MWVTYLDRDNKHRVVFMENLVKALSLGNYEKMKELLIQFKIPGVRLSIIPPSTLAMKLIDNKS